MLDGHKDSGSIAAEIKMMRMVHEGAILIVEGVNDVRFWSTRQHDTCELVDGEGKGTVVGAVHQLDAENFRGVLGVVDDDYDSLMGISPGTRNLIATDTHDLECLLCRSSALETVLTEFGVASKVKRFEEAAGDDVRTGLLDRAIVFGRLRWAAMRHDLNIDFNAIRVPQFVDTETWTVDSDQLTHAVLKGDSPDDYDVLSRRIAELPSADPWRVAQGHDMIQILRIGLKHVLGTIPTSTGIKDITRVLRAAISLEEFQTTALCAEIRTWERTNAYLVLASALVR